ncbi:MAG: hypothetical protein GY849_13745, partial [Deltaproteobacteria bacterium]|nr:hypothetical protein [Deltaproteobacteria bacterium]
MIWGGNEMPHTALMTASSATISIAFESLKDYGAKLKNASQESGQTATINTTTARRLLIGVTRPLQGIKIYVKTPNTENPTQDLEVQEWRGHGYWDSYDKWRQVSSLVDNTDGLTQTGTVTWDYSGVAWDVGGTAASRYIGGYQLYWYYCWLKAGSAEIYQVTVDAPMQRITNTWDGSARGLAKAMVYDASAGTYYDYTDEVISNDSAYYMEASTAANPLTTDDYILLGFVEPQRGFNIKMAEGNINTSASTSLVYYWGGESWVYGKKQEDGTSEDSKSLAKSGVVSFENVIPLEPEFKRSIGDDVALYYYKIRFNAALSSSDVFIYYITGIASPEVIPAYDFPGFFRNRSWLFS